MADTNWGVNLLPSTTETYALGTSSKKWTNVYAQNFYGALTGNVTGNCSGSSGSCTGNAATATALKTGRTLKVSLGSTSASTAFDGSANITDIGVSGTLAVGNGGTGKTSALDAITNLGGPYLLANGTAITESSNLNTAYNAMGTYYSVNSTRSGTLTGTVPVTGAGFKMITAIGYRAATIRQFLASADNDLLYRSSQDTGSTWTKWYKFVLLPSGSDNKTFAAIGGATTPVYVNANGVIVAGTALGTAAYTASTAYAAASHGNHVPTTATADNLKFLRCDNAWYKMTKAETSALIQMLDTASADMAAANYVITGDATNINSTTFYRRPASKIVNATLVKSALGTVSTTAKKFLKDTGSWTQVDWGDLTGKPSTFAPSSHTHSYLPLTGGTLVGTGTSTDEQWVTLTIGNTTASGTAGNYSGQIRICGPGAYYNQLRAGRSLTASRTTYLPNYAATQYLVCVSTTDAVGGANQPLRCDATGRLYACNSFVPTTGGTFSNPSADTSESWCTITIGNSTPSGTTANSSGRLRLYSNLAYYQELRSARSTLTASRLVYLPAKDANCTLVDTTGTSASGTWAISVSGSAATLTTAREIYVALGSTRDSSNKVTFNGSADKAIHVSGTLGVGRGGTGTTTAPTKGGVIYASSTSAYACTAAGTSGQFLKSNGTSAPTWASVATTISTTTSKYYLVGHTSSSGTTSTLYCRTTAYVSADGYLYASRVYNAVWNDLAEYRKSQVYDPGYVITASGQLTTNRLEPGARIISDTYGMCMGTAADENNDFKKVPVGLAGLVLAYTYRPREEYKIGDCVCSAPGGTIDIMTREEIKEWPDRIIGIVYEIPDYDIWEPSKGDSREPIKVQGRIWIDIK